MPRPKKVKFKDLLPGTSNSRRLQLVKKKDDGGIQNTYWDIIYVNVEAGEVLLELFQKKTFTENEFNDYGFIWMKEFKKKVKKHKK